MDPARGGVQLEHLVRFEQIQYLYAQLKRSTLGMMIGGAIVVTTMWGYVPSAWLIGWIGAIAANQAWRYTLYLNFRRNPPPPDHATHWGNYWALGAGLSGIIWGSSALVMFVPSSPAHQAFLVTALVGVTAGALALVTIHKLSFYAFVIPTLLPIIVRLVIEGDRLHLCLAAVSLIVFVTALLFGHELNHKLTASMRLRLLSDQLARDLETQTEKAGMARAEAEAATSAKSLFLASTAHDLGQDMFVLKMDVGKLEALATRANDAALAQRLNGAITSLGDMIEQLRQFSEIESGKLQPGISVFPLAPLFVRLRAELASLAAHKNLKLVFRPTDAAVRSDPVLLQRMLRNLITNAIHYTRQGGVLISARRRQDDMVRIEVFDTGPGIAPEDRERIFQEFQRLDRSAGSGHKGMGLGLSIVRGFALLLAHPVELVSTVGRGSRFTISVPAAAQLADAATLEPPAWGSDLAGRCVVVIDDEPAILEVVGSALRSWGCHVVAGATADDVLHAIGSRVPDLVIADYALADGANGIAAIEQIRRRTSGRVPAVLITGSIQTEYAAQAAALQLKIVTKPITPARLRSLVTGLLSKQDRLH